MYICICTNDFNELHTRLAIDLRLSKYADKIIKLGVEIGLEFNRHKLIPIKPSVVVAFERVELTDTGLW